MSKDSSSDSLTTTEEKLNFPEDTEVFLFPASFAQQRLWFLDQLAPGNGFYNVSAALHLTGSLNHWALSETFNYIVNRHETLRTSFAMVDGQLMQAISPTLTIPIPVIDLRNVESQKRLAQVQQFVTLEAKRPFHLTTSPLLRVTLLQLDEAKYLLLLNLHHIIADGWSIGVLIRELGVLYTALIADKQLRSLRESHDCGTFGVSLPLKELPIQYADFAQWQREWLQAVGISGYSPLQIQLNYWRGRLQNLSVLNLTTDRPRPAVPTYRGKKQSLELPQSLSQAIETLSQQEGVTLFMTLLAAFQTLLYRYTQQEDIAIGSPIANRNRSEIEGLIGFFVNSLVLRTDLSGNPTFRELLNRVREVTLGAYAHQDLPFEKLVEELHPDRDLSHHPLFQIVFSLQNTPSEVLELPGLTLSQFEFDSETAKLDLEFQLWQDSESIKGQVVYSTDLFDDATITRMLGHFQTLLESIVTKPQQRLKDLVWLTPQEQQQLLFDWNNTSKTYTSKCFHQLFEAQVERTPNAFAVSFETVSLTYRELNIQANQLAHHLQQLGVVPDMLVGICVERSISMIVGLLGILKAGGAYLPIDSSLPQERLNFMLEDAKMSVLLTQKKLLKHFDDFSKPISCIDDCEIIKQQSQQNPTSCVRLNNLAYVIYTSGSTGKPKGVLIEQRGLLNLAKSTTKVFNLHPNNRVLQFASLSFDASIFEIIMALAAGATLYLASKESLLPGQPLLELLRGNAITHVTLPPAVLAVLPTDELPALQTIICAGESCSQEIIKRWWNSKRRFFNAYGPTEATVWSTIAEIRNFDETLTIGRPIANTQIYILDKHLQPVAVGITGELYIGGEGVARGYLNLPELTAERFIANPFNDKNKAAIEKIDTDKLALITSENSFSLLPTPYSPLPIFKTGDLGRYQPNGNIEFLGRIDNQVKIRGFRIELSEIETVLSQHETVQKTIVIAKENQTGDKYLVAYIVPNVETRSLKAFPFAQRARKGKGNFASPNFASVLREFLKGKLPEYMIPKAFAVLDSLPLTANGKVDLSAMAAATPYGSIAALDISANKADKAYIAPRTLTELTLAKIWAEVLNLEPVGIDDNFFDLGGDSLLSVRLLEQIHQQFKRDLPLSALFLNPTIESLASSLSSSKDSLPWCPLVPIQIAGTNPPFFCVHPIFGVVFPYYELAQHLGKNQPFYGLQPIGLDGGTPLTRIEDMAAHYIEALRQVQPKGPYFLGGWSFGGLIAFEMAQQLEKSGEEVALLAVLDAAAPIKSNLPSLNQSFKVLLTIVIPSIWSFLFDYLYVIIAFVNSRIKDLTSRFPRFSKLDKIMQMLEANILSSFIFKENATTIISESRLRILSELAIRPMLRVFYANNQAVRNYIPQVYPKQITLFRTIQSNITEEDASMGWNQLTNKKTEINIIPGNHLTMLRKPYVQVLAAKLKASIAT
jgi:amino acid adenylation domain-containing protein